MKKKKENKTIVQQKMSIANHLIDNGFRCKDNDGEYLSTTETDDILMNMPILTLEHIRNDYQHIVNQRLETRRVIKPLYNAIMLKTGLGHFVRTQGFGCSHSLVYILLLFINSLAVIINLVTAFLNEFGEIYISYSDSLMGIVTLTNN